MGLRLVGADGAEDGGNRQRTRARRPGIETRIRREIRKILVAFVRGGLDALGAMSDRGSAPDADSGTERLRLVGTPEASRSVVHALAAFDAYAIEVAGEVGEQHLREVRSLLRDLVEHAEVDRVESITRDQVVAFLAHVQRNGRPHRLKDGTITKRRKPAGATSRRTYLFNMRGFFEWCVETKRLAENPCGNIRAPRRTPNQRRALTVRELGAIIAGAPPERQVLYWILAIAGTRLGATLRLPRGCFMVEARPFRIEIPAAFSKTKREYTAALAASTAELVREYRDAAPGKDRDPLLRLGTSKRIRNKLRDQLHADCKRVGVPVVDSRGRSVGLHSFRRAMITGMQDLGFDAKVAQLQAGHANVTTTLTNYTDRGIGEQVEAAEALAAAIDEASISPGLLVRKKILAEDLTRGAEGSEDVDAVTREIHQTRSSESGRLSHPGTQHPRGERLPSRDRATQNPSSARQNRASMSKWAILDSNQYRPDDIPPRVAGIVHHALSVAERWSRPDRADSQESANGPQRPRRPGEPE